MCCVPHAVVDVVSLSHAFAPQCTSCGGGAARADGVVVWVFVVHCKLLPATVGGYVVLAATHVVDDDGTFAEAVTVVGAVVRCGSVRCVTRRN